MSLFHVVALIVTLVAVFGYLNCRLFKLPEPIGITAVGLVGSICFAVAGAVNPSLAEWAKAASTNIDFSAIVVQGMLGLLPIPGRSPCNGKRIGG